MAGLFTSITRASSSLFGKLSGFGVNGSNLSSRQMHTLTRGTRTKYYPNQRGSSCHELLRVPAAAASCIQLERRQQLNEWKWWQAPSRQWHWGKSRLRFVTETVKYSIEDGYTKPNQNVLSRFYRLNNGMWIRPRAGRAKQLWKKTDYHKSRLRHHVMCTGNQCRMLDKMVSAEYIRPQYHVDDIYEPYHRHNYLSHHPHTDTSSINFTRRNRRK